MKKFFAMLLLAPLAFSVLACNESTDSGSVPNPPTNTTPVDPGSDAGPDEADNSAVDFGADVPPENLTCPAEGVFYFLQRVVVDEAEGQWAWLCVLCSENPMTHELDCQEEGKRIPEVVE